MGIETRPVNIPPFDWNKEDRQSSCSVSSLCQYLAMRDQVRKTSWTFLNHFDHKRRIHRPVNDIRSRKHTEIHSVPNSHLHYTRTWTWLISDRIFSQTWNQVSSRWESCHLFGFPMLKESLEKNKVIWAGNSRPSRMMLPKMNPTKPIRKSKIDGRLKEFFFIEGFFIENHIQVLLKKCQCLL